MGLRTGGRLLRMVTGCAVPAARFPGGGPQLDAGHGGLGDNRKVNIPYMWLEFGSEGIRLRGRRLVGGLVTPRDIRYTDITQLVVLAAPAEPRQRGIRLRTVGRPQYVYFFARPSVVQQLVEQFSCHGVRLDGQLASDRIPLQRRLLVLPGKRAHSTALPMSHQQQQPVSAAGNGDRMNEMQAPI
jgi:hypothetical protein